MKKIAESQVQAADFRRMVWEALPEEGTKIEDLLQPAYWSHVARRIKPRHRIEAHAADGSWFAEFLVRSSGDLFVNVALLRKHEFATTVAEAPAAVPPGYEVKWRGPAGKWSAVRIADKAIVFGGGERREDAEDALRKHLRQVAA